jgi:hypothetical protein
MTFTVHVEHEIVSGKTVLEEFEGVESVMNPIMNSNILLKYADDRDDEKLGYGNVVTVDDETNDD